MRQKRMICLLLSFVLLLGLFPGVSAVQENRFVLVAESGGELVIAPEYVSDTEGDTIRQALLKTNHHFVGLEDGWIMEIDGIGGNYSRSDQNGGYDLNTPAGEVTHFRISEDTDSKPSEGLMSLMNAMADYGTKSADVRAAAREEYVTAYKQFAGLDSASASVLAAELNNAVKAYEESLNAEHYGISFADGGRLCTDMEISVTNPHGKVWTAAEGRLELPVGDYTFLAVDGDTRAEGSFTVEGSSVVALTMPRENWLDTDSLRLSGSYETNEENKFTDDEFAVGAWENRTATVPVFDSFTGTVYANGKTRDVTDYVTIAADPITQDNTTVTISFAHVLYHNQEEGTGMVSGMASTTPVTTLEVKLAGAEGDVSGDGILDRVDAELIVKHYNELLELTDEELVIADVNGDGAVDLLDANILYGWINLGRNEA